MRDCRSVLTLESGPCAPRGRAGARAAGSCALGVDGLDLLVPPEVDDHNFGCFPMAPWAGRVRHGRFDFEGQRYQLPLNNPPHAIHGIARDHPWQEERRRRDLGAARVRRGRSAAASCNASSSRPTPCISRWRCTRPTSRCRRRADGTPGGVATRGGESRSPSSSHADAMYERDDDGIPTGELVPVGPHPWDDCFTELGDRPAVLRWPGAITVTLETVLPVRRRVRRAGARASASNRNPARPTRSTSAPPWSVRDAPLVVTATWSWQARERVGGD